MQVRGRKAKCTNERTIKNHGNEGRKGLEWRERRKHVMERLREGEESINGVRTEQRRWRHDKVSRGLESRDRE